MDLRGVTRVTVFDVRIVIVYKHHAKLIQEVRGTHLYSAWK